MQDAIKVEQKEPWRLRGAQLGSGSQTKIRDALLALGSTIPRFQAFGTKDQVDPVRHLIGSARLGGNPDKDAIYLNVTPGQERRQDRLPAHSQGCPVDGFWSISVYNAEGLFRAEQGECLHTQQHHGERDDDGSVTVQFGGCDGKTPNCLPITPGWNYTARLYRPRAEILKGKWKFPDPNRQVEKRTYNLPARRRSPTISDISPRCTE